MFSAQALQSTALLIGVEEQNGADISQLYADISSPGGSEKTTIKKQDEVTLLTPDAACSF